MFSDRLKKRRKELNLSQEDIAGFFENCTRQTVSKWEMDEGYPELQKALVLSVNLNMPLDEMFADELANVRKEKPADNFLKKYPGLEAGLKTFAKALEKL